MFCSINANLQIDNIRILTVGLELACNRGSCGGISLQIFAFEKIPPHEPRLQASSSPTVRIRILSIRWLSIYPFLGKMRMFPDN